MIISARRAANITTIIAQLWHCPLMEPLFIPTQMQSAPPAAFVTLIVQVHSLEAALVMHLNPFAVRGSFNSRLRDSLLRCVWRSASGNCRKSTDCCDQARPNYYP